MPRNNLNSFFDFSSGISVSDFSFHRSGLLPCLYVMSPKSDLYLYSGLDFPFCILVILVIVSFHGLSAIPNTFGSAL